MKEFSFKKSAKNRTKDILLSIVLIIVSSLMLVKSYNDDSKFGLIIFSILLFGGVYLLFKALNNKSTVIVNKEGISNNTNGMGLIPWKFIEGFEISRVGASQALVIKTNDDQALLSRMNGISRKLMQSNISKLGSPVVIMENEFDESLSTVKTKLEDYKDSL